MKNHLLTFCASASFSLLVACSGQPGEVKSYNEGINIIPMPQSLVQQQGAFRLSGSTSLGAASPEAKTIAEFFAAKMRTATGYDITVGESGNITLKLDESLDVNDEGYQLDVTGDAVNVTAKTPQGLFYGMQTFMQLLPAEIESAQKVSGIAWTAQAVSIKDEPRFGYRGIMLDPCRHFMPAENVKKFIDVLSLFKINRLHWHLTDDQGWRIEIKKYPKLTEIGSKRVEGEGTEHSGYYTQEEIKDIVKYAADHFITVVPELELPGHEMAAIAAYPELSCKGEAGTPRVIWGVEDIVMCPGKEDMFKFLEDVIDEMVPLFPSEYFHIGGDECPKTSWKNCPLCQQRIRKEGLTADKNHSAEEKLQSYVIQRMEKYLATKGKKIIGWDEILEGGISEDCIVMNWRRPEFGKKALKTNHRTIFTCSAWSYFNLKESRTQVEIGPRGPLPLEKVYGFQIVPDSLTAQQQKLVWGAQGCLWTEYIPTTWKAEFAVFPRMSALAENVWSPLEKKNWENFSRKVETQYERYELWGARYSEAFFRTQDVERKR